MLLLLTVSWLFGTCLYWSNNLTALILLWSTSSLMGGAIPSNAAHKYQPSLPLSKIVLCFINSFRFCLRLFFCLNSWQSWYIFKVRWIKSFKFYRTDLSLSFLNHPKWPRLQRRFYYQCWRMTGGKSSPRNWYLPSPQESRTKIPVGCDSKAVKLGDYFCK